MASSLNLLGLPQDAFGLFGIHLGNIVSQEVAKADRGLKAQYDPVSKKISILNTSDLPPSVLYKILYQTPALREYDSCAFYPSVCVERNKEGNLEISFSSFKPAVDSSKSPISERFGITIPKVELKEAGLDREEVSPMQMSEGRIFNFTGPAVELKDDDLDREEVSAMEKSISEGVIRAMTQYFNKHERGKGIWYPNDYRKYLRDAFDIEMDESFSTGFANEKYFEKTDVFTFKLKDGEKASEALLSFLNGPTVADCGNATMACYYKCILDILGEEKFDKFFNSRFFALTIGQKGISDRTCPLSYFADYTEASEQEKTGVVGKRPLQIGEECHFGGIIWHGNKHPVGSHGGFNVIYVGDNKEGNQLFMAHGFEKPLTENEINQKLLELYNQERTLQDEQYVTQAKKPEVYDKSINIYLMARYTVSEEEVEKNISKFIKGFLVGSITGLQATKLCKLKNAKNMDEFISKLAMDLQFQAQSLNQ